jgi:hypothetical protein
MFENVSPRRIHTALLAGVVVFAIGALVVGRDMTDLEARVLAGVSFLVAVGVRTVLYERDHAVGRGARSDGPSGAGSGR